MRIRRILFVLAFGAALPAADVAPAYAGAFLEPPGHGDAIMAASFSGTTRAFDANGRLVPVPAYRKFELGTYIEYGLSDRVTLVVQPAIDLVHQAPTQSQPAGAAGTDLGARIGLVRFGATVVSLQGMVHVPFGAGSRQAGFFDEDRVGAADLRLMFGHGFAISGRPGFLDIEASHTFVSSGLPDEWHTDVVVGLRPRPRVLVMLASFASVADQNGPACATWFWLKLQPSLVYDLSQHWSAELGFFATVAGLNAGRELGPVAALWYRF